VLDPLQAADDKQPQIEALDALLPRPDVDAGLPWSARLGVGASGCRFAAILGVRDLVEVSLSTRKQLIPAGPRCIREVEFRVLGIELRIERLVDVERCLSVVWLHGSLFPAWSPVWRR
jgi:hypothetical protein